MSHYYVYKTGLAWPTISKRVTDRFGTRMGKHEGLDIGPLERGVEGDSVAAIADGYVVEKGFRRNNGNYVKLRHGKKEWEFYSLYLHGKNHSIRVNAGDDVERGEALMTMGNTGRSTAPHLHLGVKIEHYDVNGIKEIWLDPESLYKKPGSDKELLLALRKYQR